jgi:iron complex outermembrane receptor protein
LSLSSVLNSDGSIQTNIKPETGWSREVSIALQSNNNVSAKLTGYIMDIRNTIITRRIMDDIFEKFNGGETQHRGLEAELSVSDKAQRYSWTGSYTFNDHVFSKFNDGGVDFSGRTLPGIPKHRLFQTVALQVYRTLSLSLNHHWVSDVYLNDANTERGSGYHLISSSVDYSFKTGTNWKWIVSAHLHNVLDTHYSPMFQINAPGAMPRYYYPGKPRAFYLSVGFQHDL